jgi:peroxiredoxin
VGQAIPDVSGKDLDGHDVTLASMHAKGPVLLVFYRGGWCPYCNFEIRGLTEAYPELQKRGVGLVAISVDKPEAAAKMSNLYSIPFPVLSDSDAVILKAFHVVKTVGMAEGFVMKQGFGVDLEASSGRIHHQIAIPSQFLVDRGGIVRWAHSDPDFKVRPTTAQLLAAIDESGIAGKP